MLRVSTHFGAIRLPSLIPVVHAGEEQQEFGPDLIRKVHGKTRIMPIRSSRCSLVDRFSFCNRANRKDRSPGLEMEPPRS
jgi:hypothetical protein